ncbi:MAG: hypothetical protein ABSG96_04670 [Terracidiphilus sp.]|jgi:hypothetical protein
MPAAASIKANFGTFVNLFNSYPPDIVGSHLHLNGLIGNAKGLGYH